MPLPLFKIEQIELLEINNINGLTTALESKTESSDFKTIGGQSITGSGNISLGSTSVVELTQAQYDVLPTSQKFDGTIRYIIPPIPSGYSVSIFDGVTDIDSGNETAVTINFAGAEVGAGYDYTFTSSGGGTPISGFGIIETTTDSITGIDLSSLTDGTITLTVYLTNGGGQGADVTDTSNKNIISSTQHYENRAGALVNGSDTSVAGWVAGNGISESSTNQARTGTTSLRIASNDGSTQFRYFDFSSGASGQNDFIGGETVTITGYIYAPSGAVANIQLTGSTGLENQTAISFTPDTWTQFTFSNITINSSGNLYFYTDNTTGIFIDDMTISST